MSRTTSEGRTICAGWSVLEIGTGDTATSVAGMLLAENGARVLKVEPPDGDRLRHTCPSGFLVWNRGKESLLADLTTGDGQAVVRDAACHADVLLAGAGPDVLRRWGLDDETLRPHNPALVHCSVTAFGPTGAYSGFPADDAIVAAKAGLFARGQFGFRDGPIFFNAPWASTGAAHMAFAGVLAALLVREQTGRGQRVDATLVQGLGPLDYFGTMHWQYARNTGGQPQVIIGPSGAMAATRTSLWHCTKDGRFIATVPQLPHQARALMRATGLDHLLTDPRYEHAPVFPTAEDAQAWEDALWEVFRTRTLEEWLPTLRADLDVPFEVAVTSEEGLDHPQMVHNGNVVEVDDPSHGRVRMVGPVAAFEKTPSTITNLAPELGDNAGPLTGPAAVTGAGGAAPPHALSGVTIIEAGYFYAMPFGGTMAAALGARVIKLEGADGDPMRSAFGVRESAAVRVMEGKESLSIDLQHPEGRAVVHRLVAEADVFVISFRPGVPERLGLDYETLKAVNPNLVYVYAAGYGVDGPYAPRAMYAAAAATAAGAIHRHAGYWLDPDLTAGWGAMELQAIIAPRLSVPVDGDSNAALAVLSAILLGVTHQRRTGEGQLVALSMIGGNALVYSDDFCTYDDKPPIPLPDAESYGLGALYRLYPASEGWIFLAAPTEPEWNALNTHVGSPELAADPRFATAASRRSHDDDLAEVLAATFATRPAAEWEATLTAVGVGCVEASLGGHSAFTSTDPVLLETGLTVEVDHPVFGRIVRHGLPVALSETPGRIGPSCLRGQHTDEILAELGYTGAEIATLKGAGAVFGPDER